MDAFTPQQTTELCSRIGTKKAHMRLDKLFINSCMSGPLLGFGCAVLLSTNASPWYQENAPGLIRSLGALLFPVGLVMIVLSGADLFTSNIMFMSIAYLHRRVSVIDVLKIWFVSFFGNLAGMLFFMAIITGYGGLFSETPGYSQAAVTLATQKAINPQWHQIFLRAIAANWLVCFAVFLSVSSREIVSKIVAIWWPCATFVACAFDHVIANMYFIPMGMWQGAPISASYYVCKSLIPTTLGNIIGGAIFVGLPYWYLYLTGEGAVDIDFNIGNIETALEAGGPMGRSRTTNGNRHMSQADTVIEGQDPEKVGSNSGSGSGDLPLKDANWLPHSSGQMVSGIGRELSPEKYRQRHSERTGAGAV